MIRNSDVNDIAPLQYFGEDVLGIYKHLSFIPRRSAHLVKLRGGLRRDGENFATSSSDATTQRLQLFEIGLTERAPGSSIDYQ